MNKKALLKLFENEIASSLEVLIQSAKEAHAAATHVESKAEDQYDTRGLEASYLAGAQSRRVGELQELLYLYRHVDILSFNENSSIASTALIELESEEGHRKWCLMMPSGGGMHVIHEGNRVDIVTPQSPMGEALLGRKQGDQVSIEIQRAIKDYDIIRVM